MSNDIQRVMLMILDGWGSGVEDDGNAVALADTPNLDWLLAGFPHTRLTCSGESVGLPPGVIGNSEVGHLNIGAGRIVYQDLLRINKAIEDGDFFTNPALVKAMDTAVQKNTTLHLMGLLSDSGVHSALGHLLALIRMAGEKKVPNLVVHPILDGRDSPPTSGKGFLETLEKALEQTGLGTIGTVCGRYYAMDRDKRWDRTGQAYFLYVRGQAFQLTRDPVATVAAAYEKGETDEFIKPRAMVDERGKPKGIIRNDDVVIFFNFRADRARQITRALTEPGFNKFDVSDRPVLSSYTCMTRYEKDFQLPVAFGPVRMKGILGEVVSQRGLPQLRIAETEKYAHVTYFFNGGEETPFENEDRVLVPSPREVPTYDHKPQMSADEVTDQVIQRIESDKYQLIILNFANMDMVGHTGVIPAAVKACETVDTCVGRIMEKLSARGWSAMITADHGNAEMMKEPDGSPHTAHTLNQVNFILAHPGKKDLTLRPEGVLGDIAPTILQVMGIPAPKEMTGRSLIE